MVVELKFTQLFNGPHWVYTNSKGDELSIISHKGSYGYNSGLFETMCSWKLDVQGNLTFEQVSRKIKTIYRRDK